MFHEPSVCKGLLWYAPAILALDMSVTYLSHDLMVTGDLLFLLQLMVKVVLIHTADLHSLVHMLCINMPKKWRQKRKRGSQVELPINLQDFLQQCAFPQVRKKTLAM